MPSSQLHLDTDLCSIHRLVTIVIPSVAQVCAVSNPIGLSNASSGAESSEKDAVDTVRICKNHRGINIDHFEARS